MSGDTAYPRPLTLGQEESGVVILHPPSRAVDGSGYITLPVTLRGEGLEAMSTVQLEAWGSGAGGMTAYFESLARAWKGWADTMDWIDDHRNVEFSSRHDRRGTVVLRATVRPFYGDDRPGAWGVTLFVALDAGSLESIARAMRALVREPH